MKAWSRHVLGRLTGQYRVPGDKPISHRAAILAALARGTSRIGGFSRAGDCRRTLATLRRLGAELETQPGRGPDGRPGVVVHGRGWEGLAAVDGVLDCGRSGTTIRLLAGVAAGLPFVSVLSGGGQLLRRPMDRVAEPLRRMGAEVELTPEGFPPLRVRGGDLRAIEHLLPMPSAQVKSCVLLAGLRASGTTIVLEPEPTRDHTERLLEAMGADITRTPGPLTRASGGASGRTGRVSVTASPLEPIELAVPGDISSAAALIAAAVLIPGSDVVLEQVGLNPGRTGFLRILQRMGAAIEVVPDGDGIEPAGAVRAGARALRAVRVGGGEVPAAIDELPLLGVLATQAEGVTEVRGARELRVKESDRIAGLVAGLRALGAQADELPDGFVVTGPTRLRGGRCDARADHRLAIAFTVAGLVATGRVVVEGMGFVGDSFPGFPAILRELTRGAR